MIEPLDNLNAAAAELARRQRLFAGVFEMACTGEEAAHFAGDVRVYATQKLVVCAGGTSPHRILAATNAEMLDRIVLLTLREGAARLDNGASITAIGRGDVACLDIDQPFDVQWVAGPDRPQFVMFWSPRGIWAQRIHEGSSLHGHVITEALPIGKMLGTMLGLLPEVATRAQGRELDLLGEGVTEMAVRAINHGLRLAPKGAARESLTTFLTVRRFIDQNLASTKLDVNMIARAFGVSRASVYRLMEPIGGVASYIRNSRLDRARQLLTAPRLADRPIAETAHLVGFRSISVFNRLFAERFKMSPSAARDEAMKNLERSPLWRYEGEGLEGELKVRLKALLL
jgi:AraC-like DNA-binding protein